jgi:hypothetical protein
MMSDKDYKADDAAVMAKIRERLDRDREDMLQRFENEGGRVPSRIFDSSEGRVTRLTRAEEEMITRELRAAHHAHGVRRRDR